MSNKQINKDQIISVTLFKETLKEKYKFYPEKIVKLPFTNIVLSHTIAGWSIPGQSDFYFISSSEMNEYIVRDDKLYRRPMIKIAFSSGWRDDVRLYFDTFEEVKEWVTENLYDVNLIEINE